MNWRMFLLLLHPVWVNIFFTCCCTPYPRLNKGKETLLACTKQTEYIQIKKFLKNCQKSHLRDKKCKGNWNKNCILQSLFDIEEGYKDRREGKGRHRCLGDGAQFLAAPDIFHQDDFEEKDEQNKDYLAE